MTVTAFPGPFIAYGSLPQLGSGQASRSTDYNADRSYSAFDAGIGLLDPRLGYLPGGSNTSGTSAAVIIAGGGGYVGINQAPSVAATANIAALANATSGTPMTLVTSTGAGITVLSSALFIPPTGITVPAGALAIDLAPAWLSLGQPGVTVVADARTMIARAVSITGVASGTGGNFLISGADIYGVPMTQLLTVGAGVNTVNTTKAFKFIYSVTPQFTDAHTYSVGTADVFGFPLRVDEFFATTLVWNQGVISANTGFTAAVTTNPATNLTGDVRGTYAVQSASDGTKKLQVLLEVMPWNAPTVAGSNVGLFGVTQA